MSVIERIRHKIRSREYYLSAHAEEEMAEDGFERKDVENAIFHGFVEKKLTHDVKGTRYNIYKTYNCSQANCKCNSANF